MSQQQVQPDPSPAWWRKPVVAVAGVVAVVGLTGGIAAAATSGDPAPTADTRQGQFPGGFPGGEGFGGRGGFPATGTPAQGGAPAGGQDVPAQGTSRSGTAATT